MNMGLLCCHYANNVNYITISIYLIKVILATPLISSSFPSFVDSWLDAQVFWL